MKCTRHKPEACYNCPYPDCIDDGTRSPDRKETELIYNALPEKGKLREYNVQRLSETPREP